MIAYEEIFNSSVLEVVAPQTFLEFPMDYDGDKATDWLGRLGSGSVDRKVAFFDENLDFLLTIRFSGLSSDDSKQPPVHLLLFLAHLQISYDASYISPSTPSAAAAAPVLGRPPVPPRTTSIVKDRPGSPLATSHPSIFPPATPLPIPSATESDRKYVQAQGTPFSSGIWGEQQPTSAHGTSEAFALLWAHQEREWVAVYRLSVLVSFMNTKVPDPLLCLTVSMTLRENPVAVTPARHALATLIEAVGELPAIDHATSLSKANGAEKGVEGGDIDDDDAVLAGLEEINLLEGLNTDPTFSSSQNPLTLPSTRLGPKTRKQAFSLPPTHPLLSSTPLSKPSTPSPTASGKDSPLRTSASATLRKSFRKTMQVVSGFRVRMRTVFVPYFLLPQDTPRMHGASNVDPEEDGDEGDNDDDDESTLRAREQREAGNEEHTVVLCVEIENAFPDRTLSPSDPDSTPTYDFEVERADVTVGGTGARTVLVAWGTDGTDIFPLRIAPREQVNLLYAVSFLRGPEVDDISIAGTPNTGAGTQAVGKRTSVVSLSSQAGEMQRAVTINISGRPFEKASPTSAQDGPNQPHMGFDEESEVLYPTNVYPSRWNCILDLSSTSTRRDSLRTDSLGATALPTPASPFPFTPTPVPPGPVSPATPPNRSSLGPGQAIAGSKRYTFSALDSPAVDTQGRKIRSPVNYQGPTAMLNPANQPQQQQQAPTAPIAGTLNAHPFSNVLPSTPSQNRASYMPPSVAFQSTYSRSPTTYNAPSPRDSHPTFGSFGFDAAPGHAHVDSTASDVLPPTPRTPAYPAYPGSPPPVPPTPFWQAPLAQQTGAGTVGPSVEIRRERGGPLPTPGPRVGGFGIDVETGFGANTSREPIVVSVGLLPLASAGKGKDKAKRYSMGEIYPLDQFTLDVFVFNQSSWTRRFEMSYPEDRRRRRRGRGDGTRRNDVDAPGILPLENRVRIGPLLPSTCQSVRMDFLALTPGVHAIEELTLTDIQTGFTMHLRSVMDIVVHEPYVESVDTCS
ncbi:hypothetical protein AcW1_008812 [Taiwanofungus camphoratus]|nr:hypothetical protein AcV7_003704 [Antrodia cinnamomea]KAI0949113.1 hypothetical protein AcW1_008812 [Antrodia cinnamomea]